MSYGDLRFLQNNKITAASMLTPASTAAGFVGGAGKVSGTGSALMYGAGSYTYTNTLLYVVQIDDISAGTEIGQATFRWRTSETTSGAWEATGVSTSTSLTALSNGVSVAFIGGSGSDFALYDSFKLEAQATFSVENLITFDRNILFRSGATYPIVINFGSPQNITAIAIFDHNLTGTGTLTLQGNTSDSWGSPAYSQALPITNPSIFYLNQTYAYWRIVPVDPAITYFEASHIFAGTYTRLTIANGAWGTPRTYGHRILSEENEWGVRRRQALTRQHSFSLSFPKSLSNTDFATLKTMQEALLDTDTGRVDPVIVHLFYDETDAAYLMHWDNIGAFERQYNSPEVNTSALQFSEVVRARV